MDAINYIKLYMTQHGYQETDFRIVPYNAFIDAAGEDINKDANNQFLFLASADLPTGSTIESPGNYLRIVNGTTFSGCANVYEYVFTGDVKISIPAVVGGYFLCFHCAIPIKKENGGL